MSEEIRLRPEQLFFLGQLMGARYIDYAYIADMRELGRSYPYIEQGVLTELSREGLIRKRLGGGTVVRSDVASLLMPVFFGRLETGLEITLPQEKRAESTGFHYFNGACTMVRREGNILILSEASFQTLRSLVLSAVGRHWASARTIPALRQDTVQRVICAKRGVVDGEGSCLYLAEQFGGLYTTDKQDRPQAVRDEEAAQLLLTMLKGE